MSKNRDDIQACEADFQLAINRIVSNSPQHEDLLIRSRAGKRIALNPTNIAKEAGHSRSTLYKCVDVMRRIRDPDKKKKQEEEEKENSRKEIDLLRSANERLLVQLASAYVKIRELTGQANKEERKTKRRSLRPNPNKVLDMDVAGRD